jgi:hypothetical protein
MMREFRSGENLRKSPYDKLTLSADCTGLRKSIWEATMLTRHNRRYTIFPSFEGLL